MTHLHVRVAEQAERPARRMHRAQRVEIVEHVGILIERRAVADLDQLVDDGFILMGGPLVDEGGSLLIFNAEDENEVREKMKNDPWARQGILKLESIKRWQIFIDQRTG